jgi:DNA ligase-1
MNTNLKQALDAIINIEQSSGMNRKLELLREQKDNETMKDILYFVYNPYIRVGIGYAKLEKAMPNDADMDEYSTIQGVFTYLLHNRTGRDVDANKVKTFISLQEPEYKDVLYKVFTKNFRIGISGTSIHKVWPGLLPGFAVQLACKWQDHLDFLKGQTIYLTEKLDGNRCFARVEDGECTFFSRSGKEIEGLDDVNEELKSFTNGWYDGELIASSFNETQSQTLKKGKKSNLVFNVFDYVTLKEVEHQKGEHIYRERRIYLDTVFRQHPHTTYVKLVPLAGVGTFDEDWVFSVLEEYTSNGSEGIMINTDNVYQFGRTNMLLKVKKMYTLDLRVIDMHAGTGQNENRVGALIVDYKGFRVGVGSGINNEQREYWWNHKDEIIGKIIEVKCFEESKDKSGNLSLRFPVFCRVRTDKDDVSYD